MKKPSQEFYSKLKHFWTKLPHAGDAPALAAENFLNALAGDHPGNDLPEPFGQCLHLINREFEVMMKSDRAQAFRNLEKALETSSEDAEKLSQALWDALFPEAMHLDRDMGRQIDKLRAKRLVKIEALKDNPIVDPAAQVVFTSNVLLSPPVDDVSVENRRDSIKNVVAEARSALREDQLYWYDHPIPMGIPLENDEAVYGLQGLAQALRFEKKRGTVPNDAKMTVLLSVSVTHTGLRTWATQWLKAQLQEVPPQDMADLEIYAFTEEDAQAIVHLLAPWLGDAGSPEDVKKVFGVDGEYGRHYSFLKALPALWAVLKDPQKTATFKIDLDQVFPQEELIAETGESAFQHLSTPLWGAIGRDAHGHRVELGMIAGALVNQGDIASGLFTPDIPWPSDVPGGEDLIFFKQGPMAVSTRAELMTRYGHSGSPDGKTEALQRIHVTGGTNGIRFDALRHYRPFTPTFIGRAEDQGYILSVLGNHDEDRRLRYLHASGLIMRHDKEVFAVSAVKAGKAGSYVGDLVRLFVFSRYAEFLPGGHKHIKDTVDPFTGCFITPIPTTLALLRLALHLLSADGGSTQERQSVLNMAGVRLKPWLEDKRNSSQGLHEQWLSERNAWDAYYTALDSIEAALSSKDEKVLSARDEFHRIVNATKISG